MDSATLTLADATPAHFAAIVAIEREGGPGSVVALTEGLALQEALERGHDLVVALDGDAVAGWIWFSLDAGRGGETVGQIFRIAFASGQRRHGVGRALAAHAQAELADCGCTRIRATFAGDDDGARLFLASAGYAVDAITMERPL
jgi:ribosomal protein S18 acetylase RimI-like enzyme